MTPRNNREFMVEGVGVERLVKAAAEAAAAAAASGFTRPLKVSDSEVHIISIPLPEDAISHGIPEQAPFLLLNPAFYGSVPKGPA